VTVTLVPVLTNFTRIGKEQAVARLVDAFYCRMDALPEAATIRAMHPADLGGTKEVLRRYLGEWLGGPPLYSQERGPPRLRKRHFRVSIGPAERDAWMLCMTEALDETVAEPAMRQLLHDSFAQLADWFRNDPENPHDKR